MDVGIVEPRKPRLLHPFQVFTWNQSLKGLFNHLHSSSIDSKPLGFKMIGFFSLFAVLGRLSPPTTSLCTPNEGGSRATD